MGTHLSRGRLFSLDIFFGRVLNGDRGKNQGVGHIVRRRTETGAGVSVEGSTAGVTSVGLSSELGTAAVVGSDIMLWESKSWARVDKGGRLDIGLQVWVLKTKREGKIAVEDRQ